MPLQSINPTTTKAWKVLQAHFEEIQNEHINAYFKKSASRVKDLTLKWEDFFIDYSKQHITAKTKALLIDLAVEVDLKKAIQSYFNGDLINQTENRAVLHTLLRATSSEGLNANFKSNFKDVQNVKQRIKTFSEAVINGTSRGYSGLPFTDIVNIGIGGSDLGPSFVVNALAFYRNRLNIHFINNVDGDQLAETLKHLNPATTLFIITSKTFTTQETIANAQTVRQWFLKQAPKEAIKSHFVAVSNNLAAVAEFGILPDAVFPMWDWVGGRFSLWSAVGLSISLGLGYANFEKLLQGANKMDLHFKNTAFETNLPVNLALLTIWNTNFFKSPTEALIPYSSYFSRFVPFLQQMRMESNGKSVDRSGKVISYSTCPVVWGGIGTNVQHAFFQLIHQSTARIPVEFIGFVESLHGNKSHHNKLLSNLIAQSEALLIGKTLEEVLEEAGNNETANPYKVFKGNKPSTILLIDKLTPESLGKLIALYEHKTFVEGVIWNIFSFDQFGVELGKELSKPILKCFEKKENNIQNPASLNSILHLKKLD